MQYSSDTESDSSFTSDQTDSVNVKILECKHGTYNMLSSNTTSSQEPVELPLDVDTSSNSSLNAGSKCY